MSRKRFSDEPELDLQKDEPKAVEVPLAEAGTAITPPAPPPTMVALDVFCMTSGKKPDQTRAFAGWAKRQGLRALPMAEWKTKWDEFQNRPV